MLGCWSPGNSHHMLFHHNQTTKCMSLLFIVQPKNSPRYYARWRKLHSFKVHNSHIWLPHAHAHQKWSVWWNVIFDSNVLNIVAATLLIRGIQNLPYWISLPKCPPKANLKCETNSVPSKRSWEVDPHRIQEHRESASHAFSFWAQNITAFIVQPPKNLPCYVRWRKLPWTWLPHMAPLCTCS